MSKKHNLVDSLSKSLEQEKTAVDKRFERADEIFNTETPAEEVKQKTQPKKKIEKVVRDGFTMPLSDKLLINELKIKGLSLGIDTNKSEIVRAGLQALNNLPDSKLKTILKSIPKIKTGRPADR